MPIPLGFWATAGASAASGPSFELISTSYGTGSSGTLTFSSIPATYKHLQLRVAPAHTLGYDQRSNLGLRFNGDTASSYMRHYMIGNGTGVTASGLASTTSAVLLEYSSGPTMGASPMIIDITDPFTSGKNKTVRITNGMTETGSGQIFLMSGLWINTAVTSSITIFEPNANNWSTKARFSLYGIKG
jgi:hypothetical protein